MFPINYHVSHILNFTNLSCFWYLQLHFIWHFSINYHPVKRGSKHHISVCEGYTTR
uniref:Uncharacterized protein n=1 Tax=Nelumbo nucifera TaxID=4432 RepID=A0A822Y8A7_NELNU|nr:TPA_asm: hypothetical protein HUJ06_028904 [Nelumbo nucifera]